MPDLGLEALTARPGAPAGAWVRGVAVPDLVLTSVSACDPGRHHG
ncbi:MAG: hypothetical protein WAU30_08245 [Propionicimonas sp.]